jgi:hypothetical protein
MLSTLDCVLWQGTLSNFDGVPLSLLVTFTIIFSAYFRICLTECPNALNPYLCPFE